MALYFDKVTQTYGDLNDLVILSGPAQETFLTFADTAGESTGMLMVDTTSTPSTVSHVILTYGQ